MTSFPEPPSWPPPPPPPPPPGPSGGGRRPAAPRSQLRVPLDEVPSPYGLVVACLATLIFSAPNLLVVAFEGLPDAGASRTLPDGPELIFGLVLTLGLQLVVFGLSLLPLLTAGRPFSRILGPTRATGTMWAVGLAVGIVTVFVAYAVNAVVILSFGEGDPVEQQAIDLALRGGVATVLAILLAVVLAPVTEELVFRGVLFRAVSARAGMWVGAVFSSAVFAVIHVEVVASQPFALAGLFVVGMLLAIAYHRTGSLVVPIVGHAVFNGVSITLAIVAERILPVVDGLVAVS